MPEYFTKNSKITKPSPSRCPSSADTRPPQVDKLLCSLHNSDYHNLCNISSKNRLTGVPIERILVPYHRERTRTRERTLTGEYLTQKSNERTDTQMRKVSIYSMLLGDTGIVKVGYCFTDRLRERATEHGRKFGVNVKHVQLLDHVDFNSKATAELMEAKLIKACKDAGLTMVKDNQNGETERFFVNPSVPVVSVQARKIAYNIKVC